MCGLVGAFKAGNAFWQKIDHYMWQGLYLSALRGMGGTGIGMAFEDYSTEYAKTHNSAINFLGSAEWEWVNKNIHNTRAVLGHTRSATTGKVSGSNAHPFRVKDDKNEILLIHNGHVRNHKALSSPNFVHDVDSAHVAESILKRGAIPTLELIDGAYTLIWYNKKERTLNIARNEDRDLWYVTDKANTKFYFASEIDFLASILRRNGIAHEAEGFTQFPTMALHSYDLTKAVLEPKITGYEEKKSEPVNWYGFPREGGHKSTDLNSYVKNNPGCGDPIWCKNGDNDPDLALHLYKPIGDGEGCVVAADAYGYIYGTRAMENRSIIRLNGLNYLEWKEKWQFIKDSIPMKITKVERDQKDKDAGHVYTYYEGILLKEEAQKEFDNYDKIRQRRLREDAARKQRLDYEAALSAGRAVPLLSGPEKDTKADSERSGGAVGAGVGPIHGDADKGSGRLEEKDYELPNIQVPGPGGRFISVREWKDIATQGCIFCRGKFEIELDRGRVQFFQLPCNHEDRDLKDPEYQMICPECIDDPKKMEAIAAA